MNSENTVEKIAWKILDSIKLIMMLELGDQMTERQITFRIHDVVQNMIRDYADRIEQKENLNLDIEFRKCEDRAITELLNGLVYQEKTARLLKFFLMVRMCVAIFYAPTREDGL